MPGLKGPLIFDKFASWCTAKPDNGMFKSYTESTSYKLPNGDNSKIIIIINNNIAFTLNL